MQRLVRLWTFDHPPSMPGAASHSACETAMECRARVANPSPRRRAPSPLRGLFTPRPIAEIPYRFPCAKVSWIAGIERRHIGPQLQRLQLVLILSHPGRLIGEVHRLTGYKLALGQSVGPPISLLDLPCWGGRQDGDIARAVAPQLPQ